MQIHLAFSSFAVLDLELPPSFERPENPESPETPEIRAVPSPTTKSKTLASKPCSGVPFSATAATRSVACPARNAERGTRAEICRGFAARSPGAVAGQGGESGGWAEGQMDGRGWGFTKRYGLGIMENPGQQSA